MTICIFVVVITFFLFAYANGTVDGNEEVVLAGRLYLVAMRCMQLDVMLVPVQPNR